MVTVRLPGIYLIGFSPQLNFSSRCQFHSPIFHGFLDKLDDFDGYLIHFETIYYLAWWDHIISLFVVNLCQSYIFCLLLISLKTCWSMCSSLFLAIFFTPILADGLSWSLSDSKFPQVFRTLLVFWPIFTMLYLGWPWFFFWFPTLPITFQSLWKIFQVCQLQLVSLLLLCYMAFFFILWQNLCICLSLFLFFFFVLFFGVQCKILQGTNFLFSIDYNSVWPSDRD